MKTKEIFRKWIIGMILLAIGDIPVIWATNGDIIEQFNSDAIACSGETNTFQIDIDGNGQVETMVLMITITGQGKRGDMGGSFDYVYFFTCQSDSPSDDCYDPDHPIDRGRLRIHFVDMLASGFDENDPSSWTYKRIPSASIKASHDEHVCSGVSNPYLQIKAYRQINQNGYIPANQIELPGGWEQYDFEDPEGIMEIDAFTDYSESNLDDFIIGWEGSPGVVALFDVSGSMSWNHDGETGVPIEQQRLTLAKNAAFPFLYMLNDHLENEVSLGVANFPLLPWNNANGCVGQASLPMARLGPGHFQEAVDVVAGLFPDGNTPLIAGVDAAANMFGAETHKAIVLLSDGYHNCPGEAGVDGSEFSALIDNLAAKEARVYTIGFGRPSDVDHPFLEALASETGGDFYDVTQPGFDPETWDPATALDATYATILAEGLGLEMPLDPLGVVGAGEQKIHKLGISPYDKKLSFFLSWATPGAERLGLTIRSSDGEPVPETHPGVEAHPGLTYAIVTINESFLSLPGKVGAEEWEVAVDGGGLAQGQRENYQISVLSASALRMQVSLDKPAYFVGDDIIFLVELREGGRPVGNVGDVTVKITSPLEGIGNWHVANQAPYPQIRTIPARKGREGLSFVQRKEVLMVEELNIPYPGRSEPVIVQLYDDGTHGDQEAEDGLYTARFAGLDKQGVYAFSFRASGAASDGSLFTRYLQFSKYVNVRISSSNSGLQIVEMPDQIADGWKRYKIILTPRDVLGNYLGPRYWGNISFTVPEGRLVGAVEDKLDGTYTQLIDLPANARLEDVALGIRAGNVAWASKMAAPAGKRVDAGLVVSILALALVAVLFIRVQSIKKKLESDF
ncbi:MAG: VWA domain-containing protein [Phaeodactylibacter sp.]|nr:VWA domain-containing protein [Phaeodactylibacter sp.]